MSLRQIASNLGLSITTVSRALGGHSDVSEATRQRVELEAGRLGYVPNEVARRLQKGRSDAIGFVIPGGPETFDDPYFLRIIDGAWSRLEVYDLDLLVMSAPEGPKEAQIYRRLVEGRRVDGLILTRLRQNDARLEYLRSVRFPSVVIGSGQLRDDRFVSIDVDNRSAMRSALQRLRDLGHRNVAVSGTDQVEFSRNRLRHFNELAPEYGIRPTSLLAQMTIDAGEEVYRQLCEHFPDVTAAIATGDRIGAGVVRALRARGLAAGHHLSVIAFGDSPLSRVSDPPMTSVRLPTYEMASHAIDLLLRMRDGLPVEPIKEWATELILRQTDGPPRKTA
jgi:LacI family transcriptional regulator